MGSHLSQTLFYGYLWKDEPEPLLRMCCESEKCETDMHTLLAAKRAPGLTHEDKDRWWAWRKDLDVRLAIHGYMWYGGMWLGIDSTVKQFDQFEGVDVVNLSLYHCSARGKGWQFKLDGVLADIGVEKPAKTPSWWVVADYS